MATDIVTLTDFLVSVGFDADQLTAKKAVAVHQRVQRDLTDAEAEELKKRRALEDRERDRRQTAQHREDKKGEESRKRSFKDLETFATRASGVAIKTFATIEASALGVVAAVDQAAKSFEKLNYAGRLSGTSPKGMTLFGYAASQLGSKADVAESALTAFGNNLKQYSGYRAALQRRIGNIYDKDGKLQDANDLAMRLGQSLIPDYKKGGLPYARGAAKGVGFEEGDDQLLTSLMDPRWRAREEEKAAQMAKLGVDPDAVAKSGTEFEQSMRSLQSVLADIGTKIDGVLFQKLKPLLDQLKDWFQAHGKQISDVVGKLADALVKIAAAIAKDLAGANWDKVADGLNDMADGFAEMLKTLGGEKGLAAVLAGLLATLTALRVLALPPWLAGLLGGAAAAAAGVAALQSLPDERKEEILDRHQALQDVREHRLDGSWNKVKQFFGFSKPTGNDALWARSNKGRAALKDVKDEGAGGYGRGSAARNSADLLRFQTDQLIKEGVAPENARAAAAALGGNIVQESNGNPTLVHDHNTGYGLYGARLDRRDRMLRWLAANGYKRDSAEGQARYMAHEAMTDPTYRRTADALRQATKDNLPSVTDVVAKNFESPAPASANYRGRIANAVRIYGAPERRATPLKGAPSLAVPGALGPFRPDDRPARPLGETPHSIMYQTKGDTTVNHEQTFNIHGGDAVQNLEAARLSARRGQQDVLRYLQGAEQ